MIDNGGELHSYIERIGEPIPSRCYSACTVLLAGACVPPGAVLYFHRASNSVGTILMQSFYSDRLNRHLGELTYRFTPVTAKTLAKLGYRLCP